MLNKKRYTRRLKRDKIYTVIIHVCHASKSQIAINRISILFTSDKIKEETGHELDMVPQLSTKLGYFENNSAWTNIRFKYIAQGKERYLTIGNFQNLIELTYKKLDRVPNNDENVTSNSAYYYVDDVSVSRGSEEPDVDYTIDIMNRIK